MSTTTTCIFCMESVDDDYHYLPCAHLYHSACVYVWLKDNSVCPLCKIPVYISSHEQLNEYNSHKGVRDRQAEDDSVFLQRVSSGAYDNNTSTSSPYGGDYQHSSYAIPDLSNIDEPPLEPIHPLLNSLLSYSNLDNALVASAFDNLVEFSLRNYQESRNAYNLSESLNVNVISEEKSNIPTVIDLESLSDSSDFNDVDVFNSNDFVDVPVDSVDSKDDSVDLNDFVDVPVDSVDSNDDSVDVPVDSVDSNDDSVDVPIDSVDVPIDSVDSKDDSVDSKDDSVDSVDVPVYEVPIMENDRDNSLDKEIEEEDSSEESPSE